MPIGLATQVDEASRVEGRNRSEFLREAVRCYIAARLASKPPKLAAPVADEPLHEGPFWLFAEWRSDADAVYDVLR